MFWHNGWFSQRQNTKRTFSDITQGHTALKQKQNQHTRFLSPEKELLVLNPAYCFLLS